MKENICQYASYARVLNHPNIIHTVGACTDPLSLIIEYSSKGSLTDIISKNPSKLNFTRIKSISLQILQGLNYLHSRDPPVIHQNLCSNNIIICENWVAKISGK